MEREASVAQADKKSRLCDRCFAAVPATEAFCPECGAAITEGGSDESDATVYPELARANLLRMRGDYKVAEEQCLSILRRYPNNATANILLGDISAEKGDLEHAMQWYELALDLVPDNTAAKHKLHQVRQRFKAQETAATVEQLGLPTTKSRAGVYAIALIASIFVIAVVAYFLGQRVEQRNRSEGFQTKPVTVGQQDGSGALPTGVQPGETRPSGSVPLEDSDLLQAIRDRSANGGRVVSASQDPRTKVMFLTYSVLEGEDVRALGAQIARDAFQQVSDALVITLRGTRRGRLIYAADAMRSRYEETLTSSWKEANGSDAQAWIGHVLSNEWNRDSGTPPPAGNGEPADEEQLPPGEQGAEPEPAAPENSGDQADASAQPEEPAADEQPDEIDMNPPGGAEGL